MSVHRPSGDNFRWRGRTQSSFIRMAVASQIKVGEPCRDTFLLMPDFQQQHKEEEEGLDRARQQQQSDRAK